MTYRRRPDAGLSRPSARYPRLCRALGLVLILALAAGIRFFHLAADPPVTLSSSRSIFNDGGAYALNARHKLLTGGWVAPGDNVLAQTPGFTAISFATFRVLGFGLIPLRLLSILGTMLATLLVSALCWRRWGYRAGILAALLLGIDYLFVMYGRLELIEGLLSCVSVAAAAAALQAGGFSKRQSDYNNAASVAAPVSPAAAGIGSMAWAALSAALLFLSFLIKPTGAALFPPLAFFLLCRPERFAHPAGPAPSSMREWMASRWPLWTFLLVLAMLYLGYRFLFVLPHRALFDQFREAFRVNASSLWDLRPLVIWRQALIVPGIWGGRGVLLLCLSAAGIAAAWQDRDPWSILLSFWLLTGLLYLAPQSYRPPRFTILFVPPAAALAARGAQWLWNRGAGRRLNPIAAVGWPIYLCAAAAVQPHYPPGQDIPAILRLSALAALLLIGAAAAGGRVSTPALLSRWIAVLLTVVTLAVGDWLPYAQWAAEPRHTLVLSGRRLDRLLHGQASAGDNWCAALGLMTRAPLYKIDWIPVSTNHLRAWRVHYLIYDGHETRIPEVYGKLIKTGRLVATYRVGHYPVKIVAIRP